MLRASQFVESLPVGIQLGESWSVPPPTRGFTETYWSNGDLIPNVGAHGNAWCSCKTQNCLQIIIKAAQKRVAIISRKYGHSAHSCGVDGVCGMD